MTEPNGAYKVPVIFVTVTLRFYVGRGVCLAQPTVKVVSSA